MQFLNPLFLLGSLAAIGPIIIHLVRREDSRKILFSSVMFITRMPKRSLRRQRLRHLLLLMMRVMALLLLVLAFSRPFLTSKVAAPMQTASQKSIILLIDISFSMHAGDRFQRAQEQAAKLINGLGNGDSAQIVSFSDTAQALNSPHLEKSTLQAIVKNLRPSYRKTRYAQALKLANQLLASAPNELREVHWISDFQQSGWTTNQEDVVLDQKIQLQAYDVSGNQTGNTAVSHVQIKETQNQESLLAKVSARINAHDLKAPVAASLRLELNGKLIQEKRVPLQPNDSVLAEFDNFSVPSGVSTGRIDLTFGDFLPADNIFHFSLGNKRKAKLLLLTEKEARNSFYLVKALTASAESPFTLDIQDVKLASSLDLSMYGSIVVNDIEIVPGGLVSKLNGFLNRGGGLVFVLGNRTRVSDFNTQLDRILPAKLVTRYNAKREKKDLLIGEMQKQHPLFSVFQPVHHSYFLTTPFTDYLKSTPRESSQVLIKMEDGNPLLIEGTTGKGRTLLFTSSLNLDWNDLPLKSVFLPFCQQMAKYAMNYEEPQSFFSVGDTIPLRKLNPLLESALHQISRSTGSFSQSWKVLKPSGEKTELTDAELTRSPFFTLEDPGFYQTKVHNFTNFVAANVDASESDLSKIDPQQIVASIKRNAESADPGKELEAFTDQRLALESKQHLWWYLLILAFLVLTVESHLANRYYKITSEMEV